MTVEKIVYTSELALYPAHDPHRVRRRGYRQVAQDFVESEVLALGFVQDLESTLPCSATLATRRG